jgi:hypothetical protein
MTDPRFKFSIAARDFLARARDHLKRFDDDRSVADFFGAVLNLRFGIEARLYEYLDATLKELNKPAHNRSDYVASKLLKHLLAQDPAANRAVMVRLTAEGADRPGSVLAYTPVTPDLARHHARLGDYLHYTFFRNCEYWYLDCDMQPPVRTLRDHRRYLDEVAAELAEATRGLLLTHPKFTRMIEDALDEPDAG